MTRRSLIVVRTVWVAVTIALTVAWNDNAWVLLIPLAAVGPILREVAPAPDLDERQRLLDYRASHWALIVAYLALFALFARGWFQLRKEPPVDLWLLLVAPLVVRTLITLAQGFGVRRMALVFGFVCGAVWFAFSMAEHLFSPECLIGLSIIGATALGIRWPRLGGGLLVLAGLACAILVVPVGVRNTRGDWVQAVVMMLALPLPPLLAGFGLIATAVRSTKPAPDEFGDLRKTS
jgi:hypothetical protein